ncbi:MAG: N-acetyl-gamma-glutamyl-phosphate reductase [Cyanobacteria bacterium J06632_22]
MAGKPTVFIDGEAGTTGLQIYTRLAERNDLALLRIDPDKRKDAAERQKLLNAADVSILCLPDDAAREAVSWVTNPKAKILDASSAHRTAEGWVYGFPELMAGQRDRIAQSTRVSNPGCYPTGFLACVHPLVAAGVLPADFPITINAVSGYSGGGRKLIEQYQAAERTNDEHPTPYGPYGLSFGHKHVQEMYKYSGLTHAPLFVPAVGDFEQGMLVQVPLPLFALDSPPTGAQLHNTLLNHYVGESFVTVFPFKDSAALRDGKFLDIKTANGSNQVQLFVFASETEALLAARLDNLGKGASGAAVQNLNLMLGLEESLGL